MRQSIAPRAIAGTSWLLTFFLISAMSCSAQERRMLCNEGLGTFSSKFRDVVTVLVGASKRNGTFASRTCDATLRWGKSELSVVRGALQVDIDVMGADIGLGGPVVVFQMKDSAREAGMTYEVFSLDERPKLLRTITGGSYYITQDVKLADRNEIWTDDAAAIDGFDGLPFSSYDFAPAVVLRFEKRRLIDVSSEYQSFFDSRIARVKAEIGAQSLAEFKESDGALQSTARLPMKELLALRATKIKVLEIVCAYFYSGREEEGWGVLAEMWPATDVNRIRAALQDIKRRGILRQVDAEANPSVRLPWKRHAVIFDTVTVSRKTLSDANDIVSVAENAPRSSVRRTGETQTTVDFAPEAIYLGLTVPKGRDGAVPDSIVYLDLVIDAAGKVRSAKLEKNAEGNAAEAAEINASSTWNFIPAFKSGHAVACKIRLGVLPQQ